MVARAVNTYREYPRQFWVLFIGGFISSAGGSLVWPFMTIYLRQKFDIPLSTVGLLFAIWAVAGLGATAFAGPFVDRVGRRWAMLGTMALGTPMWVAFGLANSLPILTGLFVLDSVFEPFFRTASTAMVADLVPAEKRPRAYALLRMIQNLGVVFGPAVGGFIATQSYLLAFLLASAANAIYFLIALFFIKETKPQRETKRGEREELGYGRLLRDYPFLAFVASFTLITMSYAQMMIFLAVYIKEEFAIPENFYGFIMATNAAMVVVLQYSITRFMERFRHPVVLAWGGLFIGAGVGSVALGNSFAHFLLSMVILTIGEMIVIPTSLAYVADLAPVDMRGRYMGVFTLTWSIGFGLGPVLGGALSDNVAPVAIWYGGLLYGLVSVLAFLLLAARARPSLVTASPSDPPGVGIPSSEA